MMSKNKLTKESQELINMMKDIKNPDTFHKIFVGGVLLSLLEELEKIEKGVLFSNDS